MTTKTTTTSGDATAGATNTNYGLSFSTAMVQLPLMVRESGAGSAAKIRTPDDIKQMCSDMVDLAQESFQVICLNAQNKATDRVLVTLGVLDASMVHPREVFRTAITRSAAAVVLVHNHPSGDCTPSAEDIRITRQLVDAGKIIDIKVIDHCVIGRGEDGAAAVMSMRESGLVEC